MASLMDELIGVLGEEKEHYEKLYKLGLEKNGVIVSNDLKRMQELTGEEQLLVDHLLNLNNKRDQLMSEVAEVMGKNPKHITVSKIVEMMSGQPEYERQLATLHDSLLTTVKKLREITTHNQDMLKDAIEMTEFEINLAQSLNQAPETANYDRGVLSGGTLGASYSKFDTKQ